MKIGELFSFNHFIVLISFLCSLFISSTKYKILFFILCTIIYFSIDNIKKFWVKKSYRQTGKIFDLIEAKNLQPFIDYIKKNKINIGKLHELVYYGNTTAILYAMDQDAFEIFKYLVKSGYNLTAKVAYPPILYAAYYPDEKYIEEMLKYKVDFYPQINILNGNALDIAVWRNRTRIVKDLLDRGMKFSIEHYKNTQCGIELCPWNKVKREVKELLLKNYIFKKKEKMFYLQELGLKNKVEIKIFNARHYFVENMLIS